MTLPALSNILLQAASAVLLLLPTAHADSKPAPNSARRYEGDSCDPSDTTWFPVDKCPQCFLFCDKRRKVLVKDECAELKGKPKIFDFYAQLCLLPAGGSSGNSIFFANAAGSGKVGDVCVFNTDCLQGMYCASGLCACMSTYIQFNNYCFEKINPGQQGCQYNEQCAAVWPGATCNRAATGAAMGTCNCPDVNVATGNSGRYYPVETRDGFVCIFWGTRNIGTLDVPNLVDVWDSCPLPDIGTFARRSRMVFSNATAEAVANCTYGSAVETTDASDLTKLGKCSSQVRDGYDVSDIYDCVPRAVPPPILPAPNPATTELLQDDIGVCCPSRALTCIMPPRTSEGGTTVRWYYSPVSGSCLSFTFNEVGTEANANNFATREQCESYCKDRCPRGSPQYTTTGEVLYKRKPVTCAVSSCIANYDCRTIGSSSSCCPKPASICSKRGGIISSLSEQQQPETFHAGLILLDTPDFPLTDPRFRGVTRYYYNPSTGICDLFTYYQQGGNFNNFATRADCETYCYSLLCEQGEPLKDANNNNQQCSGSSQCPSTHACTNSVCCPSRQTVCEMPQRVGTCGSYSQRYWYNAATRECEMFTFSGCQGNANNFPTLLNCQNYCRESKPRPQCVQGEPYKDASGRYYTCSTTGLVSTCPANYECYFDGYLWGCCPTQTYTCSLSRNTGIACGPRSSRWFYDASRQSCQSFEYLGCDGNSNNFATREMCENYCSVGGCPNGGQPFRENNAQLRVCSQQVTCPTTHECSTVNIAGSIINYCCPTRAYICSLPPARGMSCGTTPLTRYYYNIATRSCTTFSFEACNVGNPNNFGTLAQCMTFCNSAACSSGETTYLDPNNSQRVMTCNPSLPNTCPTGYQCKFDSLTSQSICCGATDMGVCPSGERAYVDAFTQFPRTCRPNIQGACPSNFLCRFNNMRNAYYCCASASGIICPQGRAPFRDTSTGQALVCAVNSVLNICPVGYSCQTAVNVAFQGFCCTIAPVCPGGLAFSADTHGIPRTCTVGAAQVSCPPNFACNMQLGIAPRTGTTNTGICCRTAATGGICVNGNPYVQNNQPVTCQFGVATTCPAGYTCQLFPGGNTYYCCGAPIATGVTLMNVRLNNNSSSTSTNNANISSTANIALNNLLQRNTNEALLAASQISLTSDGCPIGTSPFRVNNMVQFCSLQTPNSCPPNFSCSFSTIAQRFQCCSAAYQSSLPAVSPEGCPPGLVAYHSPGTQVVQTCSITMRDCPTPYSCQYSPTQNRYQCCGLSGGCPGNSVAFVASASGQPQMCSPNTPNNCPSGFSCQQTTSGGFACCGTGTTTVSNNPPVSQTAQACPPGSAPMMSAGTPLVCTNNFGLCPAGTTCQYSSALRQYYCCATAQASLGSGPDGCPAGQSAYHVFGTDTPQTCSPGVTGSCPQTHNCLYSTSRFQYICCTISGTGQFSGVGPQSITGLTGFGTGLDGCAFGRAYLYPGTQSPLVCSPSLGAACPSGYGCQFAAQFSRYQCCSNVVYRSHAHGRGVQPPNFPGSHYHNRSTDMYSPENQVPHGGPYNAPYHAPFMTNDNANLPQPAPSNCPDGQRNRKCDLNFEVNLDNCCWFRSSPGLICVRDEQCQWGYSSAYCSNGRCVCPSYLLIFNGTCVNHCPTYTVNREGECRYPKTIASQSRILKDDERSKANAVKSTSFDADAEPSSLDVNHVQVGGDQNTLSSVPQPDKIASSSSKSLKALSADANSIPSSQQMATTDEVQKKDLSQLERDGLKLHAL